METSEKLTTNLVNFIITIQNRPADVVGHLTYNTILRNWEFAYSEEFKTQKRYLPISSLTDIDKIYTHLEVVNWLSARVSEKTNIGDFKINVREFVKSAINKAVAYSLEIHHVQ